MLDKVEEVAVLGGGLIGLRAAYALKSRGKKVSVYVRSPQILSQIVDKESASIMQKRIEQKGIRRVTGASAKEIIGKKSVEGIVLNDGSKIDAQLVIVGKGVSPNIQLAQNAKLKTNWGIVVNGSLETTDKNIFSAGDVAESYDVTLEENSINAIWPIACRQGRVAGLNMLGEGEKFDGTLAMNSIEFFGLPVISIGITRPRKDVYEEISRKDEKSSVYKKVVLKNGIIVGAEFLNSVDAIGIVGSLIKNKVDVSGIKDMLLEDRFDYAKVARLVKDSKKTFKEKEFKESVMTL
jgi:NAD(P)H-nitrite reductase large subunit